ncbi:MAG: dTDP-glucose 4,6-dehydratase [candidate division KSB1 bacterium]|nr:dTDP-glucose 4,6-dehydratase [candidate division KSB1 bacterium]
MKHYLVTGGSGFIGSNFIRYLFKTGGESVKITNLDKLTYAGNPENLKDIQDNPNYTFIKGDICDKPLVHDLMKDVDIVVNFAAESHVDRSIGSPDEFIMTDVFGTFSLLEAARLHPIEMFVQISTDEVYGSINEGSFKETDPLEPSSPYSASKAGADRLAFSYTVTYDLPVIITRCSNNYGPFQYPEKLIPLFVTHALNDKSLPIYGDGKNIRDWIYVLDHCDAIQFLIKNGKSGQVYNIGADNERMNIEITDTILETLNKPQSLKTYIKDRLGHDRRYSLDCQKIRAMGWTPKHDFKEAIQETIQWYVDNRSWWEPIKTGEYLDYYKQHYEESGE